MSEESTKIKAEIYRELYEIRANFWGRIRQQITNRLEYHPELGEAEKEFLKRLVDESNYDYNGLLSKPTAAVEKTLVKLINGQ